MTEKHGPGGGRVGRMTAELTVKQTLTDFYREQAIERHRRQKASWTGLERFLHRVLIGWRCPACLADQER